MLLCIIRQMSELYRKGKDIVMLTIDVVSVFPSLQLETIRNRVVEVVGNKEE